MDVQVIVHNVCAWGEADMLGKQTYMAIMREWLFFNITGSAGSELTSFAMLCIPHVSLRVPAMLLLLSCTSWEHQHPCCAADGPF